MEWRKRKGEEEDTKTGAKRETKERKGGEAACAFYHSKLQASAPKIISFASS